MKNKDRPSLTRKQKRVLWFLYTHKDKWVHMSAYGLRPYDLRAFGELREIGLITVEKSAYPLFFGLTNLGDQWAAAHWKRWKEKRKA